ncbi:unnamed protein product [Somion occarium]|uniref:Uncharacterized protein n=1 Tax=Somion occarium TaxID=3059160 RepID=A0ABP1EDL2_9APHY
MVLSCTGNPSRKRKSDSTVIQVGDTQDSPPTSSSSLAGKRYRGPPSPMITDRAEMKPQNGSSLSGMDDDKFESPADLHKHVRHRVAIPSDYPYVPLIQHVPPATPARDYPFALDDFQQLSIYAIQRNESVLVSAHTSSGKTVVAEYAVAHCLRNRQRVIYTSPIKALSNQKYRDLLAIFGDVGLMTGDITLNPSASCLVMTTEILRSMLYRGSEVMREVAWVIFDEIHYMRDKERGVVWEETIILLPHTVRCVFLSATIPNAMQFAEWICKIHQQPCHVVYTDFRPTPLEHYLFPSGGDRLHLVVSKGKFLEDNFNAAMGVLQKVEDEDAAVISGKGKGGKSRKGMKKGTTDIVKIIETIMRKNYAPVIAFAFSKRECETLALSISAFEFNSTDEQGLVTSVFKNAVDTLAPEDRQLPQINNLLPLLRRGIGIHHGGLLPILKEVTELLFQEGLVKVLFATETFSIGLNMPAKTVIFTSPRKFDGREFRTLSSGEYIQMSGRAGRRGLDDKGVVFTMCDGKLDPIVVKNMIRGEADRLDSAFHLGYNMVLNLMKVEGVSPDYMLQHSFFQFQSQDAIPALEENLRCEEDNMSRITVPDEPLVAEYYGYREQLDQLSAEFKAMITRPEYCLPFLQQGRMIKVKHESYDFGWAVVIGVKELAIFNHKAFPQSITPGFQGKYVVSVLLKCSSESSPRPDCDHVLALPAGIRPCESGHNGKLLVVTIGFSAIDAISALRIKMPKDLRPRQARETVQKSIVEVQRRLPDGIPMLDPIVDMKITEDSFRVLVEKIELLEGVLISSPLHNDPRLPELYTLYASKMACQTRIRELKNTIRTTTDALQMEELKGRKRVLRRLGFITPDDVVDIKGRVACEISTGDELLLTELIFNGVFNSLSPEQCAGLLSCFIFQDKSRLRKKWQHFYMSCKKSPCGSLEYHPSQNCLWTKTNMCSPSKPNSSTLSSSGAKGALFLRFASSQISSKAISFALSVVYKSSYVK